jgi:hypothetical protein
MHKTLFVLLMVLGLATLAFGSPGDAAKTNLQPGFYNDPTAGNSQYIYIKVTLAGVMFQISNEEWIIGDPAGTWYAWPQDVYHSAGGSYKGEFPTEYVTSLGLNARYDSVFVNDCPIIWNQGGVALDFLLGVVNMAGWEYESQHSSNRMPDAINSSNAFQNAMQIRAIFAKWGGATDNYNDVNGPDNFKAPTWGAGNAFPATFTAAGNASLRNTDVVYTTAMLGFNPLTVNSTSDWQASGTLPSWLEATNERFNPVAGDLVPDATNKGLGLAPDRRVTIAM